MQRKKQARATVEFCGTPVPYLIDARAKSGAPQSVDDGIKPRWIGGSMLYDAYQFQDDLLAPLREVATRSLSMSSAFSRGAFGSHLLGQFAAGLELISRFKLSHSRPAFGIDSVRVGNADARVTEHVALALPFANLLHFEKDVETPQPRVLVVAPLSGHFSTLLAGTVRTLLSDHDVYLTDWLNARDVPLAAGRFGIDDYIGYIIRFLEALGPGTHVLAVCQPCVQTLAAAAVMANTGHPAAPRSMTLMAGPNASRNLMM